MSPSQSSKHHSHSSTSSTSSTSSSASSYYDYLPSIDSTSWAGVSVIEDDDLSFDGKSLSEWYEEERMRLSRSASEEECRGRRRYRQ